MKCSWGDFRLQRSNQFEDEICLTYQKQTYTVSLAEVSCSFRSEAEMQARDFKEILHFPMYRVAD